MRVTPTVSNTIAPMWLLKALILVGFIVLELMVGYGYFMAYLPLIIMAAVPALFLFLTARPEAGVLLLAVSAIAVPFSLSTGTQSRLTASLIVSLILIAAWVASMLLRKRVFLKPLPINIPLLGFAAANVFSLLWGRTFMDPRVHLWSTFNMVQLGALAVNLASIGVLLVTANVVKSSKWLKGIVIIFCLAGFLDIVAWFFRFQLPLSLELRGLFSMWVVALAAGQVLFNRDLGWPWRGGLVFLAAAWFYRVFFVGISWISGWFPTMVAFFVVLFFRSRRLFFLCLALLALLFVFDWDYFDDAIIGDSEREGDFGRLGAWERNLSFSTEGLAFGLGPAGYAAYYMTFIPDQGMATHSNYLDVLSQTGLVGFFFFAWFLLAFGLLALKLRKQVSGGFNRGFLYGVLGGFAGMIVAMGLGDWVLPFAYTQGIGGYNYTVYSWIMMGALASLKFISSAEK